MKTGFIIRCHYEEKDPRFPWRLAYFQGMVLPRIQAQTDKDFDICIRCNPAHDELFEKMGCKPFHVKEEYVAYRLSQNEHRKYFIDFVKWEDVIDLEQYDIQIGLDSDDLISPWLVAHVKKLCSQSSTSLHISFQPEYFYIDSLKLAQHPVRYSTRNGAMVFALYYPDKTKYHHCYEVSHRKLWKLAAKSVQVPSGFCWMTVHSQNESTGRKFSPQELKQLDRPAKYNPNPVIRTANRNRIPAVPMIPRRFPVAPIRPIVKKKEEPITEINPNQKIVIMAAGASKRWNGHLGVPKQLAPIDGEPIIHRTIRLLRERGVKEIYVTVREKGQYGELDAEEYIKDVNEIAIDRIWGARDLAPCIFLYGDVYYTERAIDIILADSHDYRFFGRRFPSAIKSNKEMYAIKANEFVIEKAGELRKMAKEKKIVNSIGQTLHYLCIGLPYEPRRRYFRVNPREIGVDYTDINDLTEDFDTPQQYMKFVNYKKQLERRGKSA
jgi:choline kinase